MVEISRASSALMEKLSVSVLYREPMWLKFAAATNVPAGASVSVLYREPMWLKLTARTQ